MERIVILVALLALVNGAEWSYEGDHGPAHWEDVSPDCAGASQSPININKRSAMENDALAEFTFNNYGSTGGLALELTNNGHAAQVNIKTGDLWIDGGALPEPYKLAQFHFHWGSTSAQGSEHTMDDHEYPMEMHLVHFAESMGSLGEAADKDEGLAVLGFFFEIGESNSNFEEIISNLGRVEEPEDGPVDISAFAIETLLPHDLTTYYRYAGSLTTPGCYESVIWTVFNEPIIVSEEQMSKFRALMNHGEDISDNYRPVQVLGSRKVYISTSAPTAAADAVHVSLISVLFMGLFAKLFV